MNISFDKSDLLKIATTLSKVANSKMNPILGTLLFEINKNEVTITGYNLEMGAKTTTVLSGMNTDSGAFCIDVKLLIGILSKINTDNVLFDVDNSNKIVISSENGRTKYDVTAFSAEDYPELPDEDNIQKITINKADFVNGIDCTLYSVSDDANNKKCYGLNIVNENNTIAFRGIDGYRLSEYITSSNVDEAFSTHITKDAAKFIRDIIAKGKSDDENIEICIMDKHIFFSIDDFSIICRKIESVDYDFSVYKRNESKNKTIVEVDKNIFLDNIDMITPLIENSAKFPVILDINADNNSIKIENVAEKGKSKTEFTANSITGDDLKIGFNVSFLSDAIKNIDSDTAIIKFGSNIDMGEIYGNKTFSIILPMRLKNY